MNLKFKFDKKNQNDPDNMQDPAASNDIEIYESESHARNVCFVEPSGRQIFLNYAYLVAGEFSPNESMITLTFTTHSVVLKGNNLEGLFESFANQTCRKIKAQDERYAQTLDPKDRFVREVVVKEI